MFSRRQFSTMLLSALVMLPALAHAHPRYKVTVAGVAGSAATGINSSGTVIGTYPFSATVTRSFVNTGTGPVDIGTLGGETYAKGINDGGEIVGMSFKVDGNRRAFLYAGTTMTDLGTLGGEQSIANAINNRGDIVGIATLGPDWLTGRAFLLRRGSSMQDLGRFEVPDPEGSSEAFGINEKRQVVGISVLGPYVPIESPNHAFLYACEEMRDLGTLGGQTSTAYAINERGVIVGEASTPDFRHNRAFLFAYGKMYNLGAFPGGEYSAASDINNHNQIVGVAAGSTGETGWTRAFLYQNNTMRSIDSLLASPGGWNIQGAASINDGGQIAATGCKAGSCYAVRLDPLP